MWPRLFCSVNWNLQTEFLKQISRPVGIVLGANRLDAQTTSSLYVALAVVNEDGRLGPDSLPVKHQLEDGRVWLHQSALVTEVACIEIVTE